MSTKNKNNIRKAGFTLVELLIVIAIIGLLSSIVLTSLNTARKKARDAKRISDMKAISNALQMFFDKNGKMPTNYDVVTVCEDANYDKTMKELIDEGFLNTIPKSPSIYGSYCYYDYGAGNSYGTIIKTDLESISPTTAGPLSSCRPFTWTGNWCSSAEATTQYCLCHPY